MFFDDAHCRPTGNAFGEKKVKVQWLAHPRKMDNRGGPVMWIHKSHICPVIESVRENAPPLSKSIHCYNEAKPGMECVADRPKGSYTPRQINEEDGDVNEGCEQFRIIFGRDEMAMNCEMGLYKDFEVTDGVIHGCEGLEHFNASMALNDGEAVWSMAPGKEGRQEPLCKLQTLEEPTGSQPLHKIIEEFAADQSSWVNQFIPTMEKMMRNGYSSLEDSAVDRAANVECPLPTQDGNVDLCYERSPSGNGQVFMISNMHRNLASKVYQFNTKTGIYDFGVESGATNQLWKWSESGTQLYNMATMKPLYLFNNFFEWTTVAKGDSFMLTTGNGLALNCKKAVKAGKGCTVSPPEGFNPQLFKFIVPKAIY